MARRQDRGASSTVVIKNLEQARFRCVFPVCGGICCKQGRPPVEPAEQQRIQDNLPEFLPHLRPSARQHIEKHGWLTRRIKDGNRTIAVEGGWCVFENHGCMLQRVGMQEGERWKYKPAVCILFPLTRQADGPWYVRQWGLAGEVWDLFCLNPGEDPTPAAESLAEEIQYANEREARPPDQNGMGEDDDADV